MAKSKGRKADDEKDADDTDPAADQPSNTTSGGQAPEPTDGPATDEGDAPQGAAHYPPSPSDSAGEKTDNIAPSKELPPDVPPEEGGGATELQLVTAERDSLAQVVRNLGGNPDEVCKTARALIAFDLAPEPGPTRKATVTPHGGSPVAVEYPAGAKDPHAAAVAAWKQAHGIWSAPTQPHVELHGE